MHREKESNIFLLEYRVGYKYSSNYKEFENFVIFLEELYSKRLLYGCEFNIFTGNTTAELDFYCKTT